MIQLALIFLLALIPYSIRETVKFRAKRYWLDTRLRDWFRGKIGVFWTIIFVEWWADIYHLCGTVILYTGYALIFEIPRTGGLELHPLWFRIGIYGLVWCMGVWLGYGMIWKRIIK